MNTMRNTIAIGVLAALLATGCETKDNGADVGKVDKNETTSAQSSDAISSQTPDNEDYVESTMSPYEYILQDASKQATGGSSGNYYYRDTFIYGFWGQPNSDDDKYFDIRSRALDDLGYDCKFMSREAYGQDNFWRYYSYYQCEKF